MGLVESMVDAAVLKALRGFGMPADAVAIIRACHDEQREPTADELRDLAAALGDKAALMEQAEARAGGDA
jgi:hypothetical protein